MDAYLSGVCSAVGGWKRGKWSVQEVRRLKRNVRAFMKVRSHYPRAGGTLMECLLRVQEYNVKDLGAFIFDNPTHQHHDLYYYIGELVLPNHPSPTHTHIHSKSLHTHTHASLHMPTAKNIKRPLFPIYRKMLRVFDVTNHVGRSVYYTHHLVNHVGRSVYYIYPPSCQPCWKVSVLYPPSCQPCWKVSVLYIPTILSTMLEGQCTIPTISPTMLEGQCTIPTISPTMLEGQCTIPTILSTMLEGQCVYPPSCQPCWKVSVYTRLLVHLFPNVATGGAKTKRKSC